MSTILQQISEVIKRESPTLSFTILEIGALPLDNEAESFYTLHHYFPTSKIIGFELDTTLCEQLNQQSSSHFSYYAQAIGRREESRPLYITNHPMCTSLYKPNEKLLSLYNNLEVASLKEISTTSTIDLDTFRERNGIGDIDFIKIDVQGAELDIFKGAVDTLQKTLMIVSEVEFIELYHDQPLFGDVNSYLMTQGFMFHKFLDLAGRTLTPIILKNNPNIRSQDMWSDTLFMKDIESIEKLEDETCLKMVILSHLYQSNDVAHFYAQEYDKRRETQLAQEIFSILAQ